MKLSPSSQAGLRLVNLNTPGACPPPRIDSTAWTGRRPRQSFKWWLHDVLWPSYSCELCLGQDAGHGCYCAHQGALSPGGPGPGWLRWRGRHLWSWWYEEQR